MRRNALAGFLWSMTLLSVTGCSHLVETRAIEQFTQAIVAEDLGELKGATSDDFSRIALRDDAAIEELKVLRIPDGKVTVLEVKEVSDDEKTVFVDVGEDDARKQRLRYRLVRDEGRRKWVVDDLDIVKKRKNMTSVKPITEQMDLLLTVREFDSAWRSGDRRQVLAVTTGDFRNELARLPPGYLLEVAREVVGTAPRSSRHPEAHLDDNVAVVRLPRAVGVLTLNLKQVDERWRVTDAALEARKNEDAILSVRKKIAVVNSADAFLDAYRDQKQDALSQLSTPQFFKGAIRLASLSAVALPDLRKAGTTFEADVQGTHANLTVTTDNSVVNISMLREERDSVDDAVGYRVDDVTIYDLFGQNSKQGKRLSALFSARAIPVIYSEALATRDIETLRINSTLDLNQRVWNALHPHSLRGLPMHIYGEGRPEIVKTEFNGPITLVTVIDGGRQVVFDIRDIKGQMLVHDVRTQTPGLPESMKDTLELFVPLQNYISGVENASLATVQRSASWDFNRRVWHQVRSMPLESRSIVRNLRAPLASIQRTREQAMLRFGNDEFGARVIFVNEHGRYLIDEINAVVDAREEGLKALLIARVRKGVTIESAARTVPPAGQQAADNPAATQTAAPIAQELR